jgi:hypothetical protein
MSRPKMVKATRPKGPVQEIPAPKTRAKAMGSTGLGYEPIQFVPKFNPEPPLPERQDLPGILETYLGFDYATNMGTVTGRMTNSKPEIQKINPYGGQGHGKSYIYDEMIYGKRPQIPIWDYITLREKKEMLGELSQAIKEGELLDHGTVLVNMRAAQILERHMEELYKDDDDKHQARIQHMKTMQKYMKQMTMQIPKPVISRSAISVIHFEDQTINQKKDKTK